MTFPIKPFWNNVIIKKLEKKESSLILPESEKDPMGNFNAFEVVAVGPGRNKDEVMPVKVGDIVMLSSKAGCTGLDYEKKEDPAKKQYVPTHFMLPATSIGAVYPNGVEGVL